MAEVSFHEVTKVFADGTSAVDTLTLRVADGEFMVLVGPSGCGKTTALRMVAGLDEPTEGAIAIGDEVVNGIAPRNRDIAMVFQSYALYPHMTVEQNLAFGLKQRRTPKDVIRARVAEVGALLALEDLFHRKPAQLSGGQRQRVAMGRALARNPRAFLLDEPLSNLDAKLRTQLRAELKRIHQAVGTTTIYVTHDQVEAMTLGQRIAVLLDGRLQQLDTPQQVYERPANLFVAGFIGSPPMNLLPARGQAGRVQVGELTIELAGVPEGDLMVGLRPEALRPGSGDSGLPSLNFMADVVEPLGNELVVHGTVGEGLAVVARLAPHAPVAPGDRLALEFAPRDVHLFDADGGMAIELP